MKQQRTLILDQDDCFLMDMKEAIVAVETIFANMVWGMPGCRLRFI